MFEGATAFDKNIASWCIDGTTQEMFKGTKSFNQNLCAWVNTDFPSKISSTIDMFDGSGCNDKSDPSKNGASAYAKSVFSAKTSKNP